MEFQAKCVIFIYVKFVTVKTGCVKIIIVNNRKRDHSISKIMLILMLKLWSHIGR